MSFQITSSAFSDGSEIPIKYTCEGEDIAPPLTWSGLFKEAKSFALIVEDPDAPDPRAPKTIWTHWVLYNIPADSTGIGESAKTLPRGTLMGLNDWNKTGYGGPCPPIGRHRYFFKLYALDTVLPDLKNPTKQKLEKTMKDHILSEAVLLGTYQKHK